MNIPVEKAMNLADGKLLYDDLRDRAESQVVIGEDEPQSETTKLWVDTDETGADYEVPTLQEFNTAIAGKEDKADMVVKFTLTPEMSQQTMTINVESNKTVAEIVQAHKDGQKIEATISVELMSDFPADLLIVPYGSDNTAVTAFANMPADGGVISILVTGNTLYGTWRAFIFAHITTDMMSDSSPIYAFGKKITMLADPTANDHAATKGYVDTALATKEDKAFNVTFNLTYDSTNDTWEVTCDKTVAEIGAAYDAGKTITAIAVRQNGPFLEVTKLIGNSLVSMSGQYMLIFSGRIFLNSSEGCVDINISGATGFPTWQVILVPNKIDDVQINGTSIISNNVANIPVANANTYGTAKVGSGGTYGIEINSNGILQTAAAGTSTIKAGTNGKQVITPNRQHDSAFYGLAKAAGDTTQAASSNAVGTYTPEAKAAIQNMLGISALPSVTASDNDKFLRVVNGAWAASTVPNAEAVSF